MTFYIPKDAQLKVLLISLWLIKFECVLELLKKDVVIKGNNRDLPIII